VYTEPRIGTAPQSAGPTPAHSRRPSVYADPLPGAPIPMLRPSSVADAGPAGGVDISSPLPGHPAAIGSSGVYEPARVTVYHMDSDDQGPVVSSQPQVHPDVHYPQQPVQSQQLAHDHQQAVPQPAAASPKAPVESLPPIHVGSPRPVQDAEYEKVWAFCCLCCSIGILCICSLVSVPFCTLPQLVEKLKYTPNSLDDGMGHVWTADELRRLYDGVVDFGALWLFDFVFEF